MASAWSASLYNWGQGRPPEAESLLAFSRPTEAANLPYYLYSANTENLSYGTIHRQQKVICV